MKIIKYTTLTAIIVATSVGSQELIQGSPTDQTYKTEGTHIFDTDGDGKKDLEIKIHENRVEETSYDSTGSSVTIKEKQPTDSGGYKDITIEKSNGLMVHKRIVTYDANGRQTYDTNILYDEKGRLKQITSQ